MDVDCAPSLSGHLCLIAYVTDDVDDYATTSLGLAGHVADDDNCDVSTTAAYRYALGATALAWKAIGKRIYYVVAFVK